VAAAAAANQGVPQVLLSPYLAPAGNAASFLAYTPTHAINPFALASLLSEQQQLAQKFATVIQDSTNPALLHQLPTATAFARTRPNIIMPVMGTSPQVLTTTTAAAPAPATAVVSAPAKVVPQQAPVAPKEAVNTPQSLSGSTINESEESAIHALGALVH